MTQPEALRKNEPLTWSTGIGTDVWKLFCACIDGNFESVQRLNVCVRCTSGRRT